MGTYSRGRDVGGVSGVFCDVYGVILCLACWWCVWRAGLHNVGAQSSACPGCPSVVKFRPRDLRFGHIDSLLV